MFSLPIFTSHLAAADGGSVSSCGTSPSLDEETLNFAKKVLETNPFVQKAVNSYRGKLLSTQLTLLELMAGGSGTGVSFHTAKYLRTDTIQQIAQSHVTTYTQMYTVELSYNQDLGTYDSSVKAAKLTEF